VQNRVAIAQPTLPDVVRAIGVTVKKRSPDILLVVNLYAEKKHTIGEICRMMGISKPTLYNYLAEASA